MTVAEIMMALFTAENDTVVEKIENGYIYFGDNSPVGKTPFKISTGVKAYKKIFGQNSSESDC